MENLGSLNSYLEKYLIFQVSRPETALKTCPTAATGAMRNHSLIDRLGLKSRDYG